MNIILTGGKTGGHIIPLLKLKNEFLKENSNSNIYYIGLSNSLEEKLCSKEENITFFHLNLEHDGIKLSNLNKFLKEYKRVKKYFLRIKPDVVISTGGFVSIPALLAARQLKIKYFLLEGNFTIGGCNKFFSKKAKKIYLTFPLEIMNKNMSILGNPAAQVDINKYEYPVDKKYKNILILGGSLGSRPLCNLAINLSKNLGNEYKITLVCGSYFKEYYQEQNTKLVVYEYINRLYNMIYNADLVISRAGSCTLSEIISINKPLIIIPSLNTKDNHQVKNALFLKENNACEMFYENKLETNDVINSILNITKDDKIKDYMLDNQKKVAMPYAATNIVKDIVSLTRIEGKE